MNTNKISKILEIVENIVECEINLYKINSDNDAQFIEDCKNRGINSLFEKSIQRNKELIKEILLNY